MLAWTMAGSNAWSQEDKTLSPAQARALIQEWMQTERLISQEKKDWQLQQQGLQQLIALYETEVEMIREELATAGDATLNFDQQTEKLKKQTAHLKTQRLALRETIAKQRRRLLGISAYFPEALKKQVEGDLLTLEDLDEELRITLVAMLNIIKSAAKFNRVVSYAEEMHEVGGEKRQLRVLYLGLARGYFLSGDIAGTGIPAKGSWVWSVNGEKKAEIENAMDVYQKVARPDLITLPVEVVQP